MTIKYSFDGTEEQARRDIEGLGYNPHDFSYELVNGKLEVRFKHTNLYLSRLEKRRVY